MHQPNDNEFSVDNYEDYYGHCFFVPIDEEYALSVQRYIPRFAWGFDIAMELRPKRILDMACLDGSNLLSMLNNLPDGTVGDGVDLSHEGIELSISRAKKVANKATFYRMPLENYLEIAIDEKKQYDLVCFYEIIEHVKDPQLVLDLIAKVLAPGGTLLISTPDFESPAFGKDDEQNKCHIRLYTAANKGYDAINKFGTKRHATSITKQLKGYKIEEMAIFNALINVRCTHG